MPAGRHKQLMLLGLLLGGPLHGYELHRIVRAHGELYSDLGKANVYYLLDRLAEDGHLTLHAEPGARGARGERLVYALTERGRAYFEELLRAILRSFESAHTGLEVALVFLQRLPPAEALALLEERRAAVATHRKLAAAELRTVAGGGLTASLAADHLLALIDAELGWLERAIMRLRCAGMTDDQGADRTRADEQHGV